MSRGHQHAGVNHDGVLTHLYPEWDPLKPASRAVMHKGDSTGGSNTSEGRVHSTGIVPSLFRLIRVLMTSWGYTGERRDVSSKPGRKFRPPKMDGGDEDADLESERAVAPSMGKKGPRDTTDRAVKVSTRLPRNGHD